MKFLNVLKIDILDQMYRIDDVVCNRLGAYEIAYAADRDKCYWMIKEQMEKENYVGECYAERLASNIIEFFDENYPKDKEE